MIFQDFCESVRRWSRPLALAAALACQAAVARELSAPTFPPGIPERPEKLKFPSLEYQPPKPQDYRVQLKNGPVAYVVEDKELPLINVQIYIRAGSYLEPKGKEGLAGLTGYLLARGGTKLQTAEELEERADFLAANLGSNIGETHGSVSLNLLSKDIDESFKILREILTEPRFQEISWLCARADLQECGSA